MDRIAREAEEEREREAEEAEAERVAAERKREEEEGWAMKVMEQETVDFLIEEAQFTPVHITAYINVIYTSIQHTGLTKTDEAEANASFIRTKRAENSVLARQELKLKQRDWLPMYSSIIILTHVSFIY